MRGLARGISSVRIFSSTSRAQAAAGPGRDRILKLYRVLLRTARHFPSMKRDALIEDIKDGEMHYVENVKADFRAHGCHSLLHGVQ